LNFQRTTKKENIIFQKIKKKEKRKNGKNEKMKKRRIRKKNGALKHFFPFYNIFLADACFFGQFGRIGAG